MMKYFLSLFMVLFFAACSPSEKTQEAIPETDPFNPPIDYVYEDIPGSDVQKVVKKNKQGKLVEEGFMVNGQKTGLWNVYDKSQVFPQKIISYQNDMYNGPYYEFTERGQMELKTNYVNNQLHGYFARYKFSQEVVTANYIHGKRDGEYKEFDERKNFLTKLETYKNDVLDGKVEYYNEDGQVIMSYEYKNGQKVSGGMIETK